MAPYNMNVIESLLQDPTVFEILINGHEQVFACRQAFRIDETDIRFDSEAHLLAYLQSIITDTVLNGTTPIVDTVLSDGSRVHVVLPPVASPGISVNIRKVFVGLPSWEGLIERETITPKMLEFLQWSIRNWTTMMVIGGAGSGKTSILNLLANEILPAHRVIHIENLTDMRLSLPHVVRLEARSTATERVTMHDLFVAAMKMRPDRVVCSEIKGTEAYEMLNVIASGVVGSMFAVHASNVSEALNRLEIWCTEANPSVPLGTLRQHIANTITLVVTCSILHDGKRRITKLSELVGVSVEGVVSHDIFEFVPDGNMNEQGEITGEFRATGYVPEFTKTIHSTGHQPLPVGFFTS